MTTKPFRVFNFIYDKSDPGTVEMLFGQFTPEIDFVKRFDDTWDLTAIACFTKLFKSRSKAKEAGFRGPVHIGFVKYEIPKENVKIYVYKPNTLEQAPDILNPKSGVAATSNGVTKDAPNTTVFSDLRVSSGISSFPVCRIHRHLSDGDGEGRPVEDDED